MQNQSMSNKNTKLGQLMQRRANDGEMIGYPNDFILVTVNEAKSRVEVHIRGPFVPPGMVSKQIATIYEMAEDYNTVAVYINSPGGSADTLTELLSAFSRYETIITIAAGQVASAGFFLWCAGTVRVVQRHTVIMAHRESYDFHGKTPQHLDAATFNEKLFGSLIDELCGDILTEQEKHSIRTTEVFLTDDDIIEREAGIAWEHFMVRDNNPYERIDTVRIDDVAYEVSNGMATALTGDCVGYTYILDELVYDIPNKKVFIECDAEEEQK